MEVGISKETEFIMYVTELFCVQGEQAAVEVQQTMQITRYAAISGQNTRQGPNP